MALFEVKGKYKEKGAMKPFSRAVEAESERLAIEKIMSLMGSEHGTSRRFIEISEAKQLNK